MQNIWRNIHGSLRARSYSSTSRVPGQVSDRVPRKVSVTEGMTISLFIYFIGGSMINAILFGLDFDGMRTGRNASATLDEQFERKFRELKALQLAREAEMKAGQPAWPPKDNNAARDA